MLERKKVTGYKVPKYPAKHFSRHQNIEFIKKYGFLGAILIALELSCEKTGTVGPPPFPPEYMTENEARQAIEKVFADSTGIDFQNDFRLYIPDPVNDTILIDGYNDSLNIGYEYPSEDDSLDTNVQTVLDSMMQDEGPYIKNFIQMESSWSEYETMLFIDFLRGIGAI
ncbi:hypothetical protein JXI42_03140 [bacterium]|nr:hypothetical protein [bacterium]